MINNKYVIFVNISDYSFFAHRSSIFKKLELFFSLISQDEQLMIWWRPHPFLKSKLKIDSNLYTQYMTLEGRFKSYGWGELDERETIDYAYKVSDIYFGDYGSVRQNFVDGGKKVVDPNYDGFFFPIGICKYGNYIYGTDHDTAAIMRLDLNNGEWRYIKNIVGHENLKKAFHKSCVIDNRIALIPYKADKLVFFDALSSDVKMVDLRLSSTKKGEMRTNFWGFYIYDDKLLLFPASYSEILAVDLKNYKTEVFMDIKNDVRQNQIITWLSWERLSENEMALSSMQDNKVMVINLKKREKILYDVGRKGYKYTEVRKYKEKLYLLCKNFPCIIEWDYLSLKWKEYFFDRSKFGIFGNSIFDDYANTVYQDKLFCIPAKSTKTYVFNMDSKDIRETGCFARWISNDISESQFDTVTFDERYLFLQHQSKKFLIFDMETEDVVKELECKMPVDDTVRMERELILGLLRQESEL